MNFRTGAALKRCRVYCLIFLCSCLAAPALAAEASPESLLAAAEMLVEDGFHELAHTRIAEAEVAADTRAQKVDAALLRAKSFLLKKEFGSATKELTDIAKDAEKAGRGEAHAFWTALVARTAGGPGRAAETLKLLPAVASDNPLASPVRRLRARCLVDTEKTEEALNVLEAANEDAAWLDAAAIAFNAGLTNRAENALLRLQTSGLERPAVRIGTIWLAMLKRERAQSATAHKLLADTLKQKDLPADLRRLAHLEQVALHVPTNTTAAARVLAEIEAAEPNPARRASFAARRGELLMKNADDELRAEGAALVRKAIPELGTEEEKAATMLSLAEQQFKAGQFKEAETAYNAHLQAFTNATGRVLALRGKAWSVFNQDRFPEAIGLFNKVFKESDKAAMKQESLFKVADCYFASGEYEKAAEEYRRFAKMVYDDPRQLNAIFQTGLSLVRAGERTQAKREFSYLVRLYSKSEYAEKAMLELANLDQQDSNWADAINQFEDYLNTYSNGAFRVEAELSRSFCAYRLGDFDRALQGFDNILKKHPNHELAHRAAHMRGWAIFLRGDEAQAREVFEDFLKTYPDAPQQEDTLFWLAERDYNTRKLAEAEDRFLSIATRFPDGRLCDQSYFWAGRCAARQKEYTRAREHYTALIKARPKSPRVPEALYGQGEALLIQGKFTDAINVLKKLVDEHPTSNLVPATWNRIGDCQRAQSGEGPDRYKDAITSYETAINAKTASDALKVEVGYRLGSIYQNLEQRENAIRHYTDAAYLYLDKRDGMGPELGVRFTQSAYAAAKLLEQDRDFDKAESLYRHIVKQGGAEAKEAEKRIQILKLESLNPFGER